MYIFDSASAVIYARRRDNYKIVASKIHQSQKQ